MHISKFKIMRKTILIVLAVFMSISSCKKDDPIYDINQIQSNSYNANKTKLKTPGQYISILYANLFQQALSANELVEITRCIESVGDKEIVHEVIISNFMNKTGVIMPPDWKMRVDYILIQAGIFNNPPFNLELSSNTFLTESQYLSLENNILSLITSYGLTSTLWEENQNLDDNNSNKFIVKKPEYSDGVGMDWFLEDTYKRFFVRNIAEAEREYFTNFLETHPNVSVEMIYTAFSLSNEYQFY